MPRLLWSLIFVAALARGETYPDLFRAEDLLSNPARVGAFYDQLRGRFRNGRFEETILDEFPLARSPRLSREAYDGMTARLKTLLEKHPDEVPRLDATPEGTPFRLTTRGTEKIEVDAAIDERLRGTVERTRSLAFLKDYDTAARAKIESALGSSPDARAIVSALVTQYNRDRGEHTARHLADALVALGIGDRGERLKGVPAFGAYLVMEHALGVAAAEGKTLGVPGKILDKLHETSSLRDVAKTNAFRKGTTLVPMSRLEAVFKGMGPGECVRANCLRYTDSLWQDNVHYKILKDGQEVGYVALTKAVEKEGAHQKVWFLETVMAPPLAKLGEGQLMMRSLLRHLQAEALKDGSQLAIAGRDFNSFNFRDTLSDLVAQPEMMAVRTATVRVRHAEQIRRYREFINSPAAQPDRDYAHHLTYPQNEFLHGIPYNSGQVRILPPIEETPAPIDFTVPIADPFKSGVRALLGAEQEMTEGEALGYYGRQSKGLQDVEFQLGLARRVGAHVKSLEGYLELVGMAGRAISDRRGLRFFLNESYARFFPMDRLSVAKAVLPPFLSLDNSPMRARMLEKAESWEEIAWYLPPRGADWGGEEKTLSRQAMDKLRERLKAASVAEVIAQVATLTTISLKLAESELVEMNGIIFAKIQTPADERAFLEHRIFVASEIAEMRGVPAGCGRGWGALLRKALSIFH